MISPSSWSLGIGRSSTETFPGPWNTTAFIVPVDMMLCKMKLRLLSCVVRDEGYTLDSQEEFEDMSCSRSKLKWVQAH
jgi:hypothetical protein